MVNYIAFAKENYNVNENINVMTFAPSGKVINTVAQLDKLPKVAGEGQSDVYVSMNPLKYAKGHINRDKDHVSRLRWLYVDLDIYNGAYKNFTKQQILGLLELDYYGTRIPVPTYVVDSGRGMYLLWRVDEHVKAYSRWAKMQKYLCDQLKEFGADQKVVTDSARVLRMIGSINSKSGTPVTVMEHMDKKYSLTNLLREYVISEQPSEKMIQYAKHIAAVLDIELPDIRSREAVKQFIKVNKEPANLFAALQKTQKDAAKKRKRGSVRYINNEYSLLHGRLSDLEKLLLQYRDYEGGSREYILFLYRYWHLCLNDDKSESLQKTLNLNSRLKNPLPDEEVIHATKSAEKYYDAGKVFRCSNKHVISALNITSEEMKGLSFFVDVSYRQERKKERNRKAYLASLKEQGKQTAQEKIRQRRKRIYKLLKNGFSGNEICKKLNISRATFYADKQCIECYLNARKVKQLSLMERFKEFCKITKEKCLKNSAPVLYMSFRTCAARSAGAGAGTYLSMRYWRSWGASVLSELGRGRCLSGRPLSDLKCQ